MASRALLSRYMAVSVLISCVYFIPNYSRCCLAGFETTSAALLTFMLVMLVHPNIQERVHQELDSVIANTCFPTLSDQSSLPAVLKEVLR